MVRFTFQRQCAAVVAGVIALSSCALTNADEAKAADSGHENVQKELTFDLDHDVKLDVVRIPAGEFLMGSPDSDEHALNSEKPRHRVRITEPFYLGKYLVTQEQWQAVMGENPSHFKGPKNPVEQVSWNDSQQFFKRLNARFRTAKGSFALPTEAQWEYACRAGSNSRYFFGDDESQLEGYAWYEKNSEGRTHSVGQKKPNAWGIYDMHGNVSEWCADWSNWYRRGNDSPEDDPSGPPTGELGRRVYRGGHYGRAAWYCRSAYRDLFGLGPEGRDSRLGLRISFNPTPTPKKPTSP